MILAYSKRDPVIGSMELVGRMELKMREDCTTCVMIT